MKAQKDEISSETAKVNILGVRVTNLTSAKVLNKIQEFLNGQKQHFLVTLNPEIILEATAEDEELWYILNHAALALADGVALKFAAWFYGKNIKRTTGADLAVEILKLAEEKKYKVAIFNWQDGLSTGEEIRQALANKFSGLDFFVQDIDRQGPYNFAAVNKFAPDIIFSTLGFPYQEKFIYYNLAKMPSAKLGLSVGGSFDFLTGKVKRAPLGLRKIGLEWLWRLYQQPKRAARIYRATVVFSFRFLVFFFILRWFYRPNIACLLYKRERATGKEVKYKILILERVGEIGHWQLPQGGTDGESLQVAGARELKEEANIENFKSLAIFKKIFKYKFPVKNQRGYKGQKQSLFIAEFTGQDSDIKVNLWEHAGWRWVEAEKLVEAVHPVRQEAAKIFLEKFWEVIKKFNPPL